MLNKILGLIMGVLVGILIIVAMILIEIRESKNLIATHNVSIERVEKKIDRIYKKLNPTVDTIIEIESDN